MASRYACTCKESVAECDVHRGETDPGDRLFHEICANMGMVRAKDLSSAIAEIRSDLTEYEQERQ